MSEQNSALSSAPVRVGGLLKGLKFIIISYVVSLLLIVLLSALIVYTDVPETISGIAVKAITFFAAFLSAFLTSRSSGSRGWLYGFFNGGANIILLMIIGMALFGTTASLVQNAAMIGGGCGAGMIGGVLGVNFSRQ